MRRILFLALTAAALVTVPVTASHADTDDSITYGGPIEFYVPAVDIFLPWEFWVTVTCDDDNCVADWESGYGNPPVSFNPESPQITATSPSRGDICYQTFVGAATVTLNFTPDTMSGVLDVGGGSKVCPNLPNPKDPHGRNPQIATFELPRVEGNPCILDEDYPGCVDTAAVPPASLPEPTGEVDDEGNPVVVIAVVVGVVAAAVAGGVAVAAASANKSGKAARTSGRAATSGAKGIGQAAADAAKELGGATKEVGDAVGSAASSGSGGSASVGDGAKGIGQAAADAAKELGGATKEVGDAVVESAKGGADT